MPALERKCKDPVGECRFPKPEADPRNRIQISEISSEDRVAEFGDREVVTCS